ncbi:MGMT family protein [Pedobacter agri]|uniref:MGMT family protein n=1 Tax=Pedobacter agri TaxID=454586 RepID=UPI00292FA497|nr:MGMT family protein [Pedobacter agri]
MSNQNLLKSSSDFYSKVYELVALILYGRVTTYRAIAKALGSAKSSRLVGIAMIHSHELRPDLPAYRVVDRNGLLTGKHHFQVDLPWKSCRNRKKLKAFMIRLLISRCFTRIR